MDFHQLRLFVAVAEELHFGRAATRVGMAQPPFSQQIRRLEQTLGVELLARTSRRVALTAAGTQLLGDARDLLDRRDRVAARARQAGDGRRGALRLGFSASSAIGLLPRIVHALGEAVPDLTLRIDDRDGLDIGAALRADLLDAAIVRGPFAAKGVTSRVVHREPFAAIVSADHPLAPEADVALGDLADESFVLFPRDAAPGLHDTIVSLAAAAGFTLRIGQEAHSWGAVAALVAGGLGVTLAPASAIDGGAADVRAVPIRGITAEAELVLATAAGSTDPRVDYLNRAIGRAVSAARA